MGGSLIIPGAVALALFAFMKGKNSNEEGADTSIDTVKDAKKEVNKSNLKHPESWFSQTSDLIQTQLVTAYRSNDAITSVLKRLASLKNKDEYLHLIEKFGKRTGYGVSFAYKEPLTKWLTYFLDNSYTYKTKSGKSLHSTGLKVAKYILKKIGVNLV